MPVSLEAGILRLSGHCTVEEALALVDTLRETPATAVDLSACTGLHTAVFQTLRAAKLPVAAPPSDAVLATHLLALLVQKEDADGR